MDPFSLVVGSVSLADSCTKLGNALVKAYSDYKGADQDVAENLLKLKVLWDRSETQMDVLRRCWDSLEARHQENQHTLLCLLENKLQNAVRLLDNIIGDDSDKKKSESKKEKKSDAEKKPDSEKDLDIVERRLPDLLRKTGDVHRGRHALYNKQRLQDAVAEFISWHSIFDPSWYLIAKSATENLEEHLRTSKSSPSANLLSLRKSLKDLTAQAGQSSKDISSNDFLEEREPIDGSSAAIAQFCQNNNYAIVDSMTVNPLADVAETTKDVKALCKALSRMDPSILGLLRCCGVIKKSSGASDQGPTLCFDIVFDIPQGLSDPHSLRARLKSPRPSLNVILQIARQLATSMLYLYAGGFVHKNIRPETILTFGSADSSENTTFLVGFESFRLAEGATILVGDQLLERELYRHPSRQGLKILDTYVLQHDMYSLGVCLLEIGLWTPFVAQSTADGGFIPGDELGLADAFNGTDIRRRALSVKKKFLKLAVERLPVHMGLKYAMVVYNCLTCLDEPRPWTEPEPGGAGDVESGVEFVEDVLTELQNIRA